MGSEMCIRDRFLIGLLQAEPGAHVYNYADKPDMTVGELVKTALKALGKKPVVRWRIPYVIGLLGGYAFDFLARITGKTYPVSSIRIMKFAADTKVSADRVRETGFSPPYSLAEGLQRMISSEFCSGSSPQRHRGHRDENISGASPRRHREH
mgnify:CR=1 FL=1